MFPDANYLRTASRDDAGMAAILASIRRIIDEEPMVPRHRAPEARGTDSAERFDCAPEHISEPRSDASLSTAVADEVLAELLAPLPNIETPVPKAEPDIDALAQQSRSAPAVDVMLAQLMQGIQRQADVSTPQLTPAQLAASLDQAEPANAPVNELAVAAAAPHQSIIEAQVPETVFDDVPSSDVAASSLSAAPPEPWETETAAAGLNSGLNSEAFEARVTDMLRPMLREWLDANMPRLVEAALQKEIAARADVTTSALSNAA